MKPSTLLIKRITTNFYANTSKAFYFYEIKLIKRSLRRQCQEATCKNWHQ